MPFYIGYATDKGVARQINQDSVIVRTSPAGDVCLAALCDGMGGFSCGEVASVHVTGRLSAWFDSRFGSAAAEPPAGSAVLAIELESVLRQANYELVRYGEQNNILTGTTASILLITGQTYCIVHVGDTRIYRTGADGFKLFTQDDNCAASGGSRSTLTQCVGVNTAIEPHCCGGPCRPGDMFFLCCDGMYHLLRPEEIHSFMNALSSAAEPHLTLALEAQINKVISRGERDNITGALIGVK